ncbi:hypothetical protein AALO_G00187210 [Alosa alosa]|uniref:Uncharacterized protein n=1 Tax=Alosa alosa TaxID=278164 RepID=A0AAV6G4E3_9TELE|nr:hypothetical protein AALO_G00187210 [Alosa alosa]
MGSKTDAEVEAWAVSEQRLQQRPAPGGLSREGQQHAGQVAGVAGPYASGTAGGGPRDERLTTAGGYGQPA